jgi:choline dehydrogenase-like flavoprotein
MGAPMYLTETERAILAVVCDAFHPRLTPGPGDDRALFSTSASDVGVPAAAEDAIARLHPSQQTELRQLLRLLDNALAVLLLGGPARGITTMSAVHRGRLLARLATSRVPQLRSGFQALKRLSSFLYYSVADATDENPAWARLGYHPSPMPRPGAPLLRITTIGASLTLDADACVIGSGAGGGVVAAQLASRGLRVVVLEAGPGDQAPDFDQRELQSTQRLFLDSGLTATRDLGVAILAGSCLGGGTAVNWQSSLPTPDYVRDEWADSSGCQVFIGTQFDRALQTVSARLSATTDESVLNANNEVLQLGCDELGYSWSRLARNSQGCDASQCGYCTFGCRVGGKQSTTVTYLNDAQRAGDTSIIPNCAARVVTMENGRATGVRAVAQDPNGGNLLDVMIRAPRVIVAAGGIQSPALLLRSGLSLPALGRNLFLHPTTAIPGVYDTRIEPWTGPPQTIVCNQFATSSGNFGFRLESAPTHPGLLGLAWPWINAEQHRRAMQRSSYASAIIALTRDAVGGRVDIRRDGTAMIDYVPNPAQQRLIAQGMVAAARVHFAAGALEVLTLHTRSMSLRRTASTTDADIEAFCHRVLSERVDRNWSMIFSAHQMGTCRMGRDPRTAVCDERGEVFGVKGLYVADASAFPASSGVNPMITVMALATCIAAGIG